MKGEGGFLPGEMWQLRQNAALLILPYSKERLGGAYFLQKTTLAIQRTLTPEYISVFNNLAFNYISLYL